MLESSSADCLSCALGGKLIQYLSHSWIQKLSVTIIHGINRHGLGLPKEELSCHDGSFLLSISRSHLFSLPFLCLLTAEGNSELCKEKMLSSTEKVMRLGRVLLCWLALLCCRMLLRGKHASYKRESPIQVKPRPGGQVGSSFVYYFFPIRNVPVFLWFLKPFTLKILIFENVNFLMSLMKVCN